jgi:hypothetical protein
MAAPSGVRALRLNRSPSTCEHAGTHLPIEGKGGTDMAVAVEMNFKGATLDQYDQVIELMGLTPRGSTPPHAISHWVAETDDGLRVVDVWESKEDYERYAEEKIGPYTQQVGFTAPPEITYHDVHNYLTAG